MAKRQNYSLKPVRRNYTYTAEEIASMYGITTDTVFRWIRDEDLKRLPKSRKYLIHSSDLMKFLEKKNQKNKKPCRENEMYCCKCRQPRQAKPASLKFKKNSNKTRRVFGCCVVCDTKMNTIVSDAKWSKSHPLYPFTDTPTKPHSGAQLSPRECQPEQEAQLCLDITL